MDNNQPASPVAATDEPASPSSDPVRIPRRLRHDGWTPERVAIFLETLAGCGVVSDACKAARMSVASAYAFRNRAAGFAVAWDAVQRHRAKHGLADEMMSRAVAGYTETNYRDGEIVGERHRYDNRLSMAVLTRLDRLAEGDADEDRLLRAVSADFDDLLDCIEDGGDLDAFVDARRPAPPPPGPEAAPEPEPAPSPDAKPRLRIEDDYDRMAALMGCLDYKAMDPHDIDVSDLPRHLESYSAEQMLRAHYSGYLAFRDCCRADEQAAEAERDAALDRPGWGENGSDEDGWDDEIDDSPEYFVRQRRIHRSRFLRRQAEAALSARRAELRAQAVAEAAGATAEGAKTGDTPAPPPATLNFLNLTDPS